MPLSVVWEVFYTINILGALQELVPLHPIRSEVQFILLFLGQYCLGHLKKPSRQMIYKSQKSDNTISKMRIQKFIILILFFTGTFSACNSIAQQSNNLSIDNFEKGVKEKNVQVLDVRTPSEFKSGHLKNAILADWTNQEAFIEKVRLLDKSKTVYTYCQIGGRSAQAKTWLIKNGFKVYNLDGGIAAWTKAGKSIE